ncbi:GntR family transcriptional regulator [Polycladomyces sp. WAk]|uniref:GntR family transcriptional regulator n=1 Tax=Polycladomyces zharkentensis TaxID=2807616 RepID=A0ABS2WJZ2_9BACL|nr:GntR family transcriptional regulator [Polycladomyces sp. WAk]
MELFLSNPKPLKVQAYTILKEAIIRGILQDHEMITERVALERFGISRTPFREAVQTLEAEGWVYNLPYKGTFISPITIKDIHDVFELRFMLEIGVVRKVQQMINRKNLDQLQAITAAMNTDPSQMSDVDFMRLDKDFHKVLFELTDNERLISVFNQTSDLIRRIGMRVLHRASRREEVVREHRSIIEGLQNGTAEQEMEQHLHNQKQSFIELYQGEK